MAEEYSFKVKKCYCGADLSKLKAEATSYRYGTQSQAKCPDCGRDMLLDAPPVEPIVKTPVETPPAKRSRSK